MSAPHEIDPEIGFVEWRRSIENPCPGPDVIRLEKIIKGAFFGGWFMCLQHQHRPQWEAFLKELENATTD